MPKAKTGPTTRVLSEPARRRPPAVESTDELAPLLTGATRTPGLDHQAARLALARSGATSAERQRLVTHLNRRVGNAAVQRVLARAGHLPGAIVQRWDAPGHLTLGKRYGPGGRFKVKAHDRDLPEHTQEVDTWPPVWRWRHLNGTREQKLMLTEGLSYAEIMALGGDFYPNFQSLNNAPLLELYKLVEMVNRPREPSTGEFQEATGGRYLALAEQNAAHFRMSVGKNSLTTYITMHLQALEAAKQGKVAEAYVKNAMADHFLTDSFAGAHLRVPRSEMPGKWGGIKSKVEHDLDGMFGVDVSNPRGDRWVAYGETAQDLDDPRNRFSMRVLAEAMALSAQELDDALHATVNYRLPAEPAAVKLVPKPVDPSKRRWPWVLFEWRLKQLIGEEAPGVVAGLFNDDDQVRAWIGRTPEAALTAQPLAQKVRMIKTLLSGWISDDDVEAVEKLGACIPDHERESVWNLVRGDVAGMNTVRQKQRVIRVLRPAGWVEPQTVFRPSDRTYGPYGVPKIGSNI